MEALKEGETDALFEAEIEGLILAETDGETEGLKEGEDDPSGIHLRVPSHFLPPFQVRAIACPYEANPRGAGCFLFFLRF